jgi:uncharacterized OB-fold protein
VTTSAARETTGNAPADEFATRAEQGELALQRCLRCEEWVWYPRPFCPGCGGRDLEWRQTSGRGTVYSFTVLRRPPRGYGDDAPYVLAYVELDEGPRLLTQLVVTGSEPVRVGLPVTAETGAAEDGSAVVRFRPS